MHYEMIKIVGMMTALELSEKIKEVLGWCRYIEVKASEQEVNGKFLVEIKYR